MPILEAFQMTSKELKGTDKKLEGVLKAKYEIGSRALFGLAAKSAHKLRASIIGSRVSIVLVYVVSSFLVASLASCEHLATLKNEGMGTWAQNRSVVEALEASAPHCRAFGSQPCRASC